MIDAKKVEALVNRIEGRKENADSYAATYRDVPDLKEIARMMDENQDFDKDSLVFMIDCYVFLSEQYESLGRFSIGADYLLKALKVAVKLKEDFDKVMPQMDGLVSSLLRDRNFYVDDDCEDVKPLASVILKEKTVEDLYMRRFARRRNLKHDPVEMSEEYLAVIDEVEERIEKNRTFRGMGSCYEIWSLKQDYLFEKGIDWKSPAALNPMVHFD